MIAPNFTKATALALTIALATTFLQTNPSMPEYENFIQRCTIDAAKRNPISDILYHIIGIISIKQFIYHTQRRDNLIFSFYSTELNTYLYGTYKVISVGLLNNFVAIVKHDDEHLWSCF